MKYENVMGTTNSMHMSKATDAWDQYEMKNETKIHNLESLDH